MIRIKNPFNMNEKLKFYLFSLLFFKNKGSTEISEFEFANEIWGVEIQVIASVVGICVFIGQFLKTIVKIELLILIPLLFVIAELRLLLIYDSFNKQMNLDFKTGQKINTYLNSIIFTTFPLVLLFQWFLR